MSELRTVVENFTNQLAQAIEAQIMERARHAVAAALGNGKVPGRRGRPPKSPSLLPVWSVGKKPRKKAPKQLCPVPGCTNPAAPVFGMVCADHKDVAKSKIKKYRAARKAKKLGAAAPRAGKATAKKVRRMAARGRKKATRSKAPAKAAEAPAAPATPAAA